MKCNVLQQNNLCGTPVRTLPLLPIKYYPITVVIIMNATNLFHDAAYEFMDQSLAQTNLLQMNI